jgi:hypothetical protein
MTDVDVRRARRFWWIAALVLPLVNPVAIVVVTWLAGGGESLGFVWLALWVGVANALFLWRLSHGVWPAREERVRRVWLGVAVDLVLSCLFAVGEFVVYLMIVCGGGGCFS